jgi:hypothetical protein
VPARAVGWNGNKKVEDAGGERGRGEMEWWETRRTGDVFKKKTIEI